MESTHTHMRSIKLWPPSPITRQVLVDRIVKNLATPSILSRKYGLLSKEDAEEDAKLIESAAFVAASQHFEKEPDSDGGSAVQLYAKESSKLMVEVIRRGSRAKDDRETIAELFTSDRETVFDISGGRRAFIEAEEAKELLKPLKEPANKYTKICFSNRSFGLPAGHVAASILSSIKDQLTDVDLSDIVSRRPEPEAVEVLKMFSSALEGSNLNYLNLSNNSLGERGIRAFGDLLKSQHNLVELYLMNAGISEHAAKALPELIPSTHKLKILHFHNSVTKDEGAVAISQIVKESPNLGIRAFGDLLKSQHNLVELYLMNAGISEHAAKALPELIPSTHKLKILHFHNSVTKDEGAVAISQIVKESPNLEDFRCSSTRVGSVGGVALAESLKNSTLLKKLDLSDNMFGPQSGVVLGKALSVPVNLTEIYLSHLRLEDEGVTAIVNGLKDSDSAIEILELAGNSLTSESARALAACITSKKHSLTKLNLSENELKDAGATVIGEALDGDFGRLSIVDLGANGIRRGGATALAKAVVGKPEFRLLNLNGNFLSNKGIEDVREIFKNSPRMLGSLEDNDPNGEDDNNHDA